MYFSPYFLMIWNPPKILRFWYPYGPCLKKKSFLLHFVENMKRDETFLLKCHRLCPIFHKYFVINFERPSFKSFKDSSWSLVRTSKSKIDVKFLLLLRQCLHVKCTQIQTCVHTGRLCFLYQEVLLTAPLLHLAV